MATMAERIQKAMDIRNMKQADLVKLTGIGKSSISTYLSGEYEPKQRNTYKIAKALCVNEAWLMGHDVPMEREPAAAPSSFRFAAATGGDNREFTDAQMRDIALLQTLLSPTAHKVGQAYDKAEPGIQSSVRKLLDVDR